MTQPTKLKIWCDMCHGSGEGLNPFSIIPEEAFCNECFGKGYTEIDPLEVQIKEWHDPANQANFHIIFIDSNVRNKVFLHKGTKEEAINFCKQKGLRVVE